MARAGRKGGFHVAPLRDEQPTVDLATRKNDRASRGVSISLLHYRQEAECFSTWGPGDLKKFSAVVAKLRGYTADELRRTEMCDKHKGSPDAARFRRPDGIAKDLAMFEIRVDRNNLARIHGVFEGDVFHLVWLDHGHRVFRA